MSSKLLMLMFVFSSAVPALSLSWQLCNSSPTPRTRFTPSRTKDSRSSPSSRRSPSSRSYPSSRSSPSSSSSPFSNISISSYPDPPIGGQTLSLVLSASSSRLLQHPIADISGTFSTLKGFFKVPFRRSLDVCDPDSQSDLVVSSPYKCPVHPGEWRFEVQYAVPVIPVSGNMHLRVQVQDLNDHMRQQLVCVDVQTSIAGRRS
eukprot:GHVS01059525.1.p1 GENE.GHVS01059525.1~~GHVS01059525.1.p1  ORF type:complete len:204 (-),score=45.05 GHVS01059525.1:546-1157(-)